MNSNKINTVNKIVGVIIMLFVSQLMSSQINKYVKFNQILSDENIGLKRRYNTKINNDTYYEIKYLGNVKSNKLKYRIINVVYYFNENKIQKQASSRIMIFDLENKFIGGYFIGSINLLPEKVAFNKLIFDYSLRKNGCKEVTEIDFSEKIPHYIFIRCNGKDGELYEFNSKNPPQG